MSRNSYRGLTLALVLIVSLGIALPAAAAGRADRDRRPAAPAAEAGLLARLLDWIEHLWSGAPKDDQGWSSATAASGVCNPDRGILIDPNGKPCNN